MIKNADFSAMSIQPKGLYVSEVVHKAFIQISKEGTEAVAATGVKGGFYHCGSRKPEPICFTIDHPFVFMI